MTQASDILVFARASLPGRWLPEEGAVPRPWESVIARLELFAHAAWRPRASVETDPAWKQPIPYVVLRDRTGAVALYRRAGGERRLHDLWSLGVGGHVERQDRRGDDLGATLLACARRELAEEAPGCDAPLRFLGLINEERTEVGTVHWGLVFEARVAVRPEGGAELGALEWVAPAAARERRLELWSRLALRLLDGLTP